MAKKETPLFPLRKGLHSRQAVQIDDAAPIATSYPVFIDTAIRLGAQPRWLNR